jgi:hypothetical protein
MRSGASVREGESIAIRSFRVVFDLERRIHKIDRWRIPVPYGIPLRAVAYWAAALFATIVLTRVPVAGAAALVLPIPVRLGILPVAIAYCLTRVQVDGRRAHTAVVAWLRFKLSPSRLAGLQAAPALGAVIRLGDITLIPDGASARYRKAVIDGPATVLLRYPPSGVVRRRLRPKLHVEQLPGPALFIGKRIRLRAGQRMVVHG